MNKNALSMIGLLAAIFTAGQAFADGPPPWAHDRADRGAYSADAGPSFAYARVLDAHPIVRHMRVVTPRQECRQQQVQVPTGSGYHSATPTIVGGIVGGVVGSQIGKGRGRTAAIVAGTLLGGSIGRDMGHQNDGPPAYTNENRTTCRTVNVYHREERIVGYRVRYRFGGHDYVARIDHRPRRWLRVRVVVTPAP